jgi:hypothetical protein
MRFAVKTQERPAPAENTFTTRCLAMPKGDGADILAWLVFDVRELRFTNIEQQRVRGAACRHLEYSDITRRSSEMSKTCSPKQEQKLRQAHLSPPAQQASLPGAPS